MLTSVGLYAAVGLALGLGTSLIPGVANLAVVESGIRGVRRRTIALSAGAAVADVVHAGAAMLGIAGVVSRHDSAQVVLFLLSGLVIAAFGVATASRGSDSNEAAPVSDGGGFGFGLLLTLFNPAALIAWITVAAAIAPKAVVDCIALTLGVGLGAFAALTLLGGLALRGHNLRGQRRAHLSRWIGVALIAFGVVSVGRGVLRLLG